MARWSKFTVLATLAAAGCSNGPRSAAQANLAQSSHSSRAVDPDHEVARPAPDTGHDESPQLLTLAGRNSGASHTPTVAPTTTARATPPSGGYIVRGTGASSTTAAPATLPPPPPPTTAYAPPSSGVASAGHAEYDGSGVAMTEHMTRRAESAPPRDSVRSNPLGLGSSGSDDHGRGRVALAPAASAPSRPASRSSGGMGGGGYAVAQSNYVRATSSRGPSTPSNSAMRASPHHTSSSGGAAYREASMDMDIAPSREPTVAPARQVPPPAPVPVVVAPGGAVPATVATSAPQPVQVTIAVTTPAVPPPPPPVVPEAPPVVVETQQNEPPAGILTAASVGDTDRRANYLDYLSRHSVERDTLGLDMTRRVRFHVVDAQSRPVNAARIVIRGAGGEVQGLSHADGFWDFYPGVSAPMITGEVAVHAEVANLSAQAAITVPAVGDGGDVEIRMPAAVSAPPPVVDLGFVIDVTGSMGDELRYVNREVTSIVRRVQAAAPGVHVRVSATFYRDRYDDVQLQQMPFTPNVEGFAGLMQQVSAYGGGDYPEDVNAGLEAAMTRLAWSDGPAVRVMVLIADAPPQPYADEQYTYRTAMADAARRGIRILPVAASGSNREVEYLFRALGSFTSTPYVYLTDDSGVGGGHMEADTDRVAVERFNDMLTRLIVSDLQGRGMHEPGPLGAQGPAQQQAQ